MYCPQCGNQIGADRVVVAESNPVGSAGLGFSILALLLCWMPVVGNLLWVMGAACSIVGLFGRPKGAAIVGFVISFFWVIVTLLALGGVATGLSFLVLF